MFIAVQAKQLIESKKQELAAARVWRQQQEEYEVGFDRLACTIWNLN